MSEQLHAVPQSQPPTILVVDDEPSITKLCKAILQQADFSVLTAEGSSEALKICTQHDGPIDLLLTDLVLPPPGFQLASSANQFPHVHGHELAVRALRIRNNLRVILMSGKIDQELAGIGRNWQDMAYTEGGSLLFQNHLSPTPWLHLFDKLFTRLLLQPRAW